MEELVISHDGELTTTDFTIAEGIGIKHRRVRELIQGNLAGFEEFGGRSQKYAVFQPWAVDVLDGIAAYENPPHGARGETNRQKIVHE